MEQVKIQARKKIWQVETGYHCAVMGTCLGRADLRRLKRKKVFGLPTGASDYEVHNAFAGIGDGKTVQARALQKALDEKYAAFVKRYAGLDNDGELWEKWQEDSGNDQAPGAFWAIITHGAASAELVARVYGECHMISFDTFSRQRSSSVVVQRLEAKVAREERKGARLTEKLQKQQEKNAQIRKELREEKSTGRERDAAILRLQQENDELSSRLSRASWSSELEEMQKRGQSLQEEVLRLQEELAEAKRDACDFRAKANSARVQKEQLAASFAEMQFAQESGFFEESYAGQCEHCEECGAESCAGPDLCGKMVLYVGGRSNMIHLYRQLVEQRGGRFSHHDGGRENSRQQLPRLLSGADVVLCPVDCVSHDACKQVKRICKRYCKPFVMMRSSGVSALEKELEAVA